MASETGKRKEVWLVEDRVSGRPLWTRIGTAFELADGSWDVRLTAVPVAGGRINMREPSPKKAKPSTGINSSRPIDCW